AQRGLENGESGDISAWLCQGRDQAAPDRIGNHREYDWYRAGLARERRGTGTRVRHHDVWAHRHQLCCKGPEALSVAVRPTVFDMNIAACRPSQAFQLSLKCSDARLAFRVGINESEEHTDPSQPARLLRPRRERPCDRCTPDK